MKHTIKFTIKAIVALAVVFGIIVYLISDHLVGATMLYFCGINCSRIWLIQ